jgi:hypothetical protein
MATPIRLFVVKLPRRFIPANEQPFLTVVPYQTVQQCGDPKSIAGDTGPTPPSFVSIQHALKLVICPHSPDAFIVRSVVAGITHEQLPLSLAMLITKVIFDLEFASIYLALFLC